MYMIPTFITEAFCLVACAQLFKRNVKVKVMACTAKGYSDYVRRLVYKVLFNTKAMPIIEKDYSYCTTAVTNNMESISCHIMPLVSY